MLKNKKGAIELSMTTIIVIVMGVTLLILGITFVRTIFTKIQNISETTFDQAGDILGEIENVNEFLTITPNVKEIEQGKDGVAKVTIANFGEDPITVNVETTTKDKKIKCEFLDEGEFTNKVNNIEIKSGSQERLALVIQDGKGNLRTTGCSVKVTGEGTEGEDNTDSVEIKAVSSNKSI